MERLSNRANSKIKLAASVRDSAKARRSNGCFFIEGARLCSDAAQSGVEFVRAFFTDEALEKYPDYVRQITSRCDECYVVTQEISLKLSDTQNPQGIFCVCKSKISVADADIIKGNGKYILLERVQDPSNLGAIVRTAEALGLDGVIVSGGCDIYNPKALRASMGSLLRLPVYGSSDLVGFLKSVSNRGMITLASTPDSSCAKINEIDLKGGVVCVVGNEGNGVTRETCEACTMRVTIPMSGRAESLNASTAAAILMWEMMRR
ncbi:MAG: RNA methyltransferase [Clostridia bacterium]|nr:RNA methyltransferase [Clostridia bacterium]